MGESPDRLELDSRLTDLCRVWPWTEGLAEEHGLAGEARFALHLCMEEALANIVLHGYRNEPGHPIVIRSWAADGWLLFAIEDEAPPFVPVNPDAAGPKPSEDLDSIEPGGNGIRLLYKYAGSLRHEELPHGNRLTMGFRLAPEPSEGGDPTPRPAAQELSWE